MEHVRVGTYLDYIYDDNKIMHAMIGPFSWSIYIHNTL